MSRIETKPASEWVKSGYITEVGVVGAGQMGAGIAQVMAQAGGMNVVLVDVSEAVLQKARDGIAKSLDKFVKKGVLGADEREAALGRIRLETSTDALADTQLVVEAIVENEALKCDLFKTLDQTTRPSCILASNTSSISLTRLAAATQRPERVIGMHFMNPVPLMKLVEIIRGAQTSDDTFAVIAELTERLGKTGVMSRDFPGFISNRVLMPLINEAIFALYEGVGSAEDIDTVMKLGMNHPMGPLQLADFIGLDTCLSIINVLHDGFKDPRFRPCPLLRQYVDAGWLGRKTGKGFFSYS